tara:strand:+ start:70 stop:954 length:885 start_codon:yes stop_codon:yes gene_type:complete
MSSKEFYLHIGYPKTASTFIRKQVFNSKKYFYLGKFVENKNFFKDLFQSLIYVKNDQVFIERLKNLNIKNKFQRLLDISGSKDLFYSDENILNFTTKVDIKKRIERLKIIITELGCTNFKIIVTHRDPVDLIMSNISQNLLLFEYLKNINFETLRKDIYILSYLNLDELKHLLEKLFTKDKILFFNYNLFITSNILNLENIIYSKKKINRSLKFNTKNYYIFICKFKFRDMIRKYKSNKNLSSLLKRFLFNLKNLILIYKKKDLDMLRKLYLNKNTFCNREEINLSNAKAPVIE